MYMYTCYVCIFVCTHIHIYYIHTLGVHLRGSTQTPPIQAAETSPAPATEEDEGFEEDPADAAAPASSAEATADIITQYFGLCRDCDLLKARRKYHKLHVFLPHT